MMNEFEHYCEEHHLSLEVVTAQTSDGWDLRVFHYRPLTGSVAPFPVVLCHGLAANKNSCDFGQPGSPEWERYSLAAYLTQQHIASDLVFDVWVPELRGNGPLTFDPIKNPEKFRWTVDDYIEGDVPAIIDCVKQWYKNTNQPAPPIFWVGKSMGGMVAYAYGETVAGTKDFKGVVTIGSPVVFGKSSVFLEFLTRITPRNLSLPIRITDLLEASSDLGAHFKGLGVNLENVDPQVLHTYLSSGLSGILSSKVLSQFSVFFRHHTFCRYPRNPWLYDTIGRLPGFTRLFTPYSYTENLARFTEPLLVIAGGKDKMAPKEDAAAVVDRVSSTDVTSIELSQECGYSADYGHLDLNLGLHAREEVYPKIYEWLQAHC